MLTIPKAIVANIIDQARQLDPQECCGILAGQEAIVTQRYPVTNILATMPNSELAGFQGAKLSDLQRLSPAERADIAFQMDAREMSLAQKDIRTRGLVLQAFYHSHPCSPARPSETDITIAMEFEHYREQLNLPQPLHIILSLQDKEAPDLRAYRIQKGQAIEVSLSTRE